MMQFSKEDIIKILQEELSKPVVMQCEIAEGCEMPVYSRSGDAGMDLRAAADISIAPGQTVIISTGFKVVIPEGFEVAIRGRSGINSKTPLKVAYGTIDSGYRGDYGVVMTNHSPENTAGIDCTLADKNKFGTYHIKKGDRIAQIVLSRFSTMRLVKVDEIASIGENRGGGFGSSGVK